MTELEKAGERNLYRLQQHANNLCAALRKIAEGCDEPDKVALKALKSKINEPNWKEIQGE